MGAVGYLPLQGKIPTAEPGIEPGTSWLEVRISDHRATTLVVSVFLKSNQQSQYSVLCWQSLTFKLSNVMSLLQRGDLLYHVNTSDEGP
jgi:hypothetical protein